MLFGRDLPQLLEADAVFLRLVAVVELELRDQLLGQRAARAFADQRVFAAQFHAAHEAVLGLAVAADAHVAGGDAHHGALFVVQHFACGKAGVDLHAQFGGLLAEPFAHRAKADDVVAVVLHEAAASASWASVISPAGPSTRKRSSVTGVSTGAPLSFQSGMRRSSPTGSITAPERMWAPTSEPFSRTTTEMSCPAVGCKLLQANGGRQSGRARADDHTIELHCLPRRQCGAIPSHLRRILSRCAGFR